MNHMDVDHDSVPSRRCSKVEQWPVRVIPLAVNVTQFPAVGRALLAAGRGDR
jgi:hypothetical protein